MHLSIAFVVPTKNSVFLYDSLKKSRNFFGSSWTEVEQGSNVKNPSFFADYIIIWVLPKMVVPQIIHFNRVFHYKPSNGVPLFLETPISVWKLKSPRWTKPGAREFFHDVGDLGAR